MPVVVREFENENDLNFLFSAFSFSDDEKQRIKTDFDNCCFRSLYATSDTNQDVCLGIVVFCDSYSTWQHRIFFCSDIYLNSLVLQTKQQKLDVLRSLFDRLFEIARNNNYHRTNLNINHEIGKETIELVCELGAVNLTEKEEWLIFEMKLEQMKEFSELKLKPLNSEYELIKLESDLSPYVDEIIDLIREISVFEKMEDQFETSRDDLIRDFKHTEHASRLNLAHKILSRYYEVFVLVKGNFVVGYSIYHLKYELKKGLGFYLEEIYIRESYRHLGLGTILWQTVTEDILSNYKNATYMHWTVLSWNKNAIDFYYKFKSINLNEREKLNHIRFTKDVIYSK